MQREKLVSYLDSYLRIDEIADYGPQGLQIEGRAEVRKIVALVDSHQPCVAAALGCDAFVTGETSHAQYYEALNAGMNVLYGGHYGTETVGVQALGRHLAEKFGLEYEFVDLPTGL